MKILFSLTPIVSLVLIGLNISCSNDGTEPISDDLAFADYLDKTVSDENIPGIIAAIADSNGIILIGSAGERKINSSEEITTNDLFHLGSCTKAMTSALLATLVAEDEIQWETTLLDAFPELEDIIHQDFHNITLHELVTHRAGLESNATDWRAYEGLELTERRLSILIDNLENPSSFLQGEYNYSNLGYMIAGCMAERITGRSWETLIRERIFEPLGMSSAGFGPPGTVGEIDQPWGHYKVNSRWRAVQRDNPEALGPAGRVHCTFEDWAKFMSLFLKKGNTTVLERNQLNALIEPVGDYACGWGVAQRDWGNGTVLNHTGSNTMWCVTVWVAPEINRTYFAGTNSYDENSAMLIDKVIRNLIRRDQITQ